MSVRTSCSPSGISQASRLEFNPQGTPLAERIRAGGANIPAFFTKTERRHSDRGRQGSARVQWRSSSPETGLVADLAIVHAWKGDTAGNRLPEDRSQLQSDDGDRRGDHRGGQASVPASEIDPDHPHTGIYVKRMIFDRSKLKPGSNSAPRASAHNRSQKEESRMAWTREQMAARAAESARRLLRQSRHWHSGAGVELPAGVDVSCRRRTGMLGMGPFPYEGRKIRTSSTPASRR